MAPSALMIICGIIWTIAAFLFGSGNKLSRGIIFGPMCFIFGLVLLFSGQ